MLILHHFGQYENVWRYFGDAYEVEKIKKNAPYGQKRKRASLIGFQG